MFARRTVPAPIAITARARVDRRTKTLLRRLQPGEVAIIDHEDLDRLAAEALVQARPSAVVNAAASISGRYPTVGPLLLAAAGIPLLDRVGSQVLDAVREGDHVLVDGDEVRVDGEVVGRGTRQTLQSLDDAYEAAKRRVGIELERFAENTLEYLRRERHLLVERMPMPDLRTAIRGRHVLIVVRGADYREDLAHLRSYVREMRPVLVGVDGGADALLEFGLRPDLVVGDFDSVSDRALRCGAELVVHAYPDGRAPGAARLEALGLEHVRLETPGTSEDVAMLLAFEKGAELIVAVGTHTSMIEMLDKGRKGMSSTFLVRLLVNDLLVDAKGVSKLYASRIRKRDLIAFLLAAVLCFVVLFVTVVPRVYVSSLWLIVRDLWRAATS